MLAHAFEVLNLPEIVSFTVVNNEKSRRVMEKIGLAYQEGQDFEHPSVPQDSALKHHVLYRLTKAEYLQSKESA